MRGESRGLGGGHCVLYTLKIVSSGVILLVYHFFSSGKPIYEYTDTFQLLFLYWPVLVILSTFFISMFHWYFQIDCGSNWATGIYLG